MIDLTKIDKPYGMLDAESQKRLKDAFKAGEAVEMFRAGLGWCRAGAIFVPSAVYRLMSTTKPVIDWSHVGKGFKYLAVDGSGAVYVYTRCPERGRYTWINACAGESAPVNALASYRPGNCDWQDSLVSRPDAESLFNQKPSAGVRIKLGK